MSALMVAVVLRVLAIICFVIALVIGFDWKTSDDYFGWLALGAALFVASFLPWGVWPKRSAE